MSEIIKITSPVDVKNRITNMPKPHGQGAIFDLSEPDGLSKEAGKVAKAEEEGARQELLKHLNKDIMQPLMEHTKAQADGIRKLVLYSKLFQVSHGAIKESFLSEFFLLPKELLGELLKMEDAASIFKGDFFEALRVLAKGGSFPKLEDSIMAILKHFDCFVNEKQSLEAIQIGTKNLSTILIKQDAQILNQLIDKLEALINSGGAGDLYKEISGFLKNELVPILRDIASNYPPTDRVQDSILSIIHYIVRFDRANPQLLDDAFQNFAEELKPLFTHLTKEDLADMKETLLRDAEAAKNMNEGKASVEDNKDIFLRSFMAKDREDSFLKAFLGGGEEEIKDEKLGLAREDKDMASLLAKALDKSSPGKINTAAQALLMQLVQSESPMQPLLHFLIPLRFNHEDTYGEFFVDKECEGRKGEAKKATNIFFTIQSDLYGTFEVDLLAKDQYIELDIKCPKELLDDVKNIKSRFRNTIEEAGYRLSSYQVDEYSESKTILRRFPHLANRRLGIDVRI